MRHRIAGNKLSRNQTLRKATIRDLAKATLLAERICTTKTKAKEARKMVEKLITLGKKGTLSSKRQAFSILCDHRLVSDLFNKTSPRFATRVGGYTRIITLGTRSGDNAQMAFLELTEKSQQAIDRHSGVVKVKEAPTDKKTAKPKATETQPKVEDAQVKEETPQAHDKETPQPGKDNIKTQHEKKPTKNITGSIRKIFQRKTGSS